MSRPPRDLRSLLAPLLAGSAALALYARTLPPGLSWSNNGADGGDLLAAALTGGVPHPTGYPTYQLLLRSALHLMAGDPARTGAWLSAACAVLAVALLADLAQRSVSVGDTGRRWAATWAGLIAALAWAASPGLWSQATIVEVYALNSFFFVALLWLAWRSVEAGSGSDPSPAWLIAAGFVLGLGLGNHLTIALILPGVGVWLLTANRGHAWQGKTWGLTGFSVLAGAVVYAYLPAAASRHPPINWGNPTTPAAFLWVVTGRLYGNLAFGLPLDALPRRLLGWATWTVTQFTPWGFALVLAGLWRLDHLGQRCRAAHAWWLATFLIWFTYTVYAIGYNTTDSLTYLLPASAVMALWLAQALYPALAPLERRPVFQLAAAILALAALPLASGALNWQRQDLSQDEEARAFVAAALAEAEPGAVILVAGDQRTFALWYGVYGLRLRPDIAIVNVNLYGYEWYRRSLADTHLSLIPSENAAPSIDSLIAALSKQRPVYAAEALGIDVPLAEGQRTSVLSRLRDP